MYDTLGGYIYICQNPKRTTVKANVKYGLFLIMVCQCWLIVGLDLITNVPNVPHCKMMMGEALCFGGLYVGVEYVGMTQQPHGLVLTQMILKLMSVQKPAHKCL